MHYIAWRIAGGAVPYRDLLDMNLPGAYLIHLAVLALAGPGDLPWRLLDLAWLGLTGVLLYAYSRPLVGPVGGATVPVLFALYHLAGGAWRVGQRDFLLCAPLLGGALGVARAAEGRGGRVWLAAAGLLLGAATTIKPQAGLFWLACAALAGTVARPPRLGRAQGPLAVLAGGCVVPALLLGWLGWSGGLEAFVSVFTGYVLPLYGQVGRVSPWEALRGHAYGYQVLALLGLLAVAGTLVGVGRAAAPRRWLALAGSGYGLVHYLAQGKGWEYHLYPLACFLCALAAPALGLPRPAEPARTAGSRVTRPTSGRAAFLRWALAMGATVSLVSVLAAKGVDALEAPWIAAKARRVDALARDVGALVAPGGRVQAMDVTAGGIHALLRLGLVQPTRFVYDFHFFHHPGDPRVEGFRQELIAGLTRAEPGAVVVLEDAWPVPGYERLAAFPALATFLDDRYRLAVEGDGYRIYAKRSDP
jgi:hypothetical protein